MRKPCLIAAALLLSIVRCQSVGAAQLKPSDFDDRQIANFYRGKVVRIVVGFPPLAAAPTFIHD